MFDRNATLPASDVLETSDAELTKAAKRAMRWHRCAGPLVRFKIDGGSEQTRRICVACHDVSDCVPKSAVRELVIAVGTRPSVLRWPPSYRDVREGIRHLRDWGLYASGRHEEVNIPKSVLLGYERGLMVAVYSDVYFKQTKQPIESFRTERRRNYLTYLQSAEWQSKRAQVIARSGGVCESCGKARGLDVHHKTYARLTDERLDDLMHVCRPCHEAIHGGPFKPGDDTT